MSEQYVEIMIQSLKNKIKVMDVIIELDEQQKVALEDPMLTPEAFDELVEKKSDMIDQLLNLDSGFEKLFERVKLELQDRKDDYKEQIAEMKEMIREITDKSVQIQAQEARNKTLMTNKFEEIKKSARNVRKGSEVVTKYYQSMNKTGYIDSQFWDQKKQTGVIVRGIWGFLIA